jgi:hypothetical protein
MSWAALLYHRVPALTFSLITALKQWSQVTTDWDLCNCKPKQIFPPWGWFSKVFCHMMESWLTHDSCYGWLCLVAMCCHGSLSSHQLLCGTDFLILIPPRSCGFVTPTG